MVRVLKSDWSEQHDSGDNSSYNMTDRFILMRSSKSAHTQGIEG